MIEVGPNNCGASPPKPMLGSKSSQPGKTKRLQLGKWSSWMVIVVGKGVCGNEPTQADTLLEGLITGKGQIHRFIR